MKHDKRKIKKTIIILSVTVLLLAAAVGSTPLISLLGAKMDERGWRVWPVLRYGVIPAVLLLLSTAALVGDSYNPFIYFQF